MARVKRHALASLAGALGAATLGALGGCGGTSDKDAITAVVLDVAHHPTSLCTRHATPDLLTRAGGLTRCLTAATAPTAQEPNLRVISVTVTGDSARARFVGKDGANTLRLLRLGSDWKVASVGG
ncbi:MAG TPA: hypothetical protein VGN69_03030 [Solirubrobacteraceae bacterium]|jgi:hypothetical protein|nr:hypothetical protein [Solirubrobacteraceae bacterium]